MTLDGDLCYRAMTSRDARFDGRFFIAVRTTGIYCRPICPARTPLRRNVEFFRCAAAAEEAGFRPCRRCRPDAAPGAPPWAGTSVTVSRALRLIEAGEVDEAGLDRLADSLGVGARHLRRLFVRHLGTSAHAVASARRAHQARLLLDATLLPIAEVALASGFGSVRQFNDAIRARFRATPTELRRGRRGATGDVAVRLSFRPPLEWAALLRFLSPRALPGVEEVDLVRATYRRTVATASGAAILSASLARDGRAVELRLRGAPPADLLDLVRRTRRLFDLDADPMAIAACLGATPLVAGSVAGRPGLRIPGAWDRFEVVVRAMVGQQISVAAATTLCGRLVQRFGARTGDATLTHLFPTPASLATDLTGIGLPRMRAANLSAVAAAIARDPRLLEPAPDLDALVARLCELPGIGPWTAHYVAMRGFGEPDAFPTGDLGLCRAAGIPPRALDACASAWRPWRAYAAIHLWGLDGPGELHADRSVAS